MAAAPLRTSDERSEDQMKTALFLFATLAGGCATRAMPAAFPSTTAASPQAREAARTPVVTTLRSDPPLPGEPLAGWSGLEPAIAAPPPSDAPARPAAPKGSNHHAH
jgi:hypothetical protein